MALYGCWRNAQKQIKPFKKVVLTTLAPRMGRHCFNNESNSNSNNSNLTNHYSNDTKNHIETHNNTHIDNKHSNMYNNKKNSNNDSANRNNPVAKIWWNSKLDAPGATASAACEACKALGSYFGFKAEYKGIKVWGIRTLYYSTLIDPF